MVETTCSTAWMALQLGLVDYEFISCNDTSAFLFPLPNCCTGVGIQEGNICGNISLRRTTVYIVKCVH